MNEGAGTLGAEAPRLRFYFRLFILTMIAAGLLSCGKFEKIEPGETTVTIGGSNNKSADVLRLLAEGKNPFQIKAAAGGGIMVYAMHAIDRRLMGRRFLIDEYTQVNWVVPNGPYYFYAVGFENSDMSGIRYCGASPGDGGSATPIALNGSSRNIFIGLSQCTTAADEDSDPPWGSSLGPYTGGSALVGFCNSDPNISCVTAGWTTKFAQWSISEMDEFGGIRPPLPSDVRIKSLCIPIVAGPPDRFAPSTFSKRPFIGSLNSLDKVQLRLELFIYTDTNCTSYYGNYSFPQGLVAADYVNLPTVLVNGRPQDHATSPTMSVDPAFQLQLRTF